MNNFTILHLSDLHFDLRIKTMLNLHRNLLEDIRKEMKLSKEIIIVLSGDLCNMGFFKNSEVVEDFFNKLKEILGDRVKDVIIVPGNHDKKLKNDVQKYKNSYINYDILQKPDLLDNNWKSHEWKFFKSCFKDYIKLREKILKIFGLGNDIKETYGCKLLEIDGRKIAFILLNTAWSCQGGSTERRTLRIGNFQISELKEEYNNIIKDNEVDLTIAVGHHPLNWFSGHDQDLISNAFLSKDSLGVDVYLCGHTHNRDIINWNSNSNSLTTLVSGIGWPDESEEGDPHQDEKRQCHTYSIYVFNLDINSIDVYVRSTSTSSSKFEFDFSMYNEENISERKITTPINPNNNKSYFLLNTKNDRSKKSYYLNNSLLSEMKLVNKHFFELKDFMRKKMNLYILDLLGTVDDLEKKEEYQVELFSLENKKNNINSLELIKKQKKILYANFENYLSSICDKICHMIVNDKWGEDEQNDIIRVHFRYCEKENGKFIYKKLVAHYPKYVNDDLKYDSHRLSDIEWGDLLAESFKTEESLIYSVNKDFCERPLAECWHNFITIIPKNISNFFDYKNTKRPYITFGITVNSARYDNYLYLLNFFQFENILSNIIEDYIKLFDINLKEFITYLCEGRENDE